MIKILPSLSNVEKAILIGFTVALVILIGVGIVSYYSTSRLIQTVNWVNRTYRVQVTLADLRAHLFNLESAARGYVITHREQDLSPYKSAVQGAKDAYRDLLSDIREREQQQKLAQLSALITDQVTIAQGIIDARNDRGFEAAVAMVEGGLGRKATEEINVLLDEMESAERALLSQRAASAEENQRRVTIVMVVGVVFAAFIVGCAVLFIRKDMAERRRAECALRESREQLQGFLDNANDLICSVTPEGAFLYVNRKWREILGYDEVDQARVRFQDIVHPDFRQHTEAIRMQVCGGKSVDEFETVLVTKEGHSVTVSGHFNGRIEEGRTVAARGMFRNISESKRAEEALQRSNEVLLRSVNELEQRTREISKLSEMGDLLQSCQKLEEAYKVIVEFVPQMVPSNSGSLGAITSSRNLVEIVAEWGPEKSSERVFLPEDCWGLRRGRMHVVRERTSALICRHVGQSAPECYLCIPLVAQGEAVGLLHLQFSAHLDESLDVAAQTKLRLVEAVADRVALALANLRLHEAMRQQSVRDPLTGLFNRRYMEESLDRELRRAARGGRSLGILMLDLDFFKHFNDNFGHDAGDAMLREFSGILQSSIRGGDIACRYGGEEFAVILPEASLEATRQRAEVIREKTKHLNVSHRGLGLGTVTLSVGVVAFPQHGASSEVLFRAADEALYAAKQGGRDRVVVAPLPKEQPAEIL